MIGLLEILIGACIVVAVLLVCVLVGMSLWPRQIPQGRSVTEIARRVQGEPGTDREDSDSVWVPTGPATRRSGQR